MTFILILKSSTFSPFPFSYHALNYIFSLCFTLIAYILYLLSITVLILNYIRRLFHAISALLTVPTLKTTTFD